MNKDLEQFSEERLKDLMNVPMDINVRFSDADIIALARIALSAKQAKPVAEIRSMILGNPCIYWFGDDCELPVGTSLYTIPQPAHTEQVIQDGWKLVPVEPTEKMKAAAEGEYSLKLAYKAMLRAAPKPESE